MPRVSVYGYTLQTGHPLVSFLEPTEAEPDVVFTCGSGPPASNGTPDLIYESVLPGTAEEGLFSLYRLKEGFKLRYAGTADFYIDEDRIHCHLLDPHYAYWVEIALLGPVMSFWLELRGSIALHASAVVAQDVAIGFMAGPEAGKTSLAASFVKRGARLLSDDILPVHPSPGGGVVARPGYPQVRMWPDEVRRFAGDPGRYPLAHPDHDKRRIPVSVLGSFHGEPVRLACLMVPERRPEPGADIVLERLAGAEALMTLLRASFAAAVLEHMPEMQARRLSLVARILRSVPVYRLRYPAGFDRLPRVHAKIMQALREA
jgi:hypothetical protein